MALSGSTVVRATTQNNLIFYWEAVQSIADNSSTINWQLLLEAKQHGQIIATPGSPWSVTVAGKAFSGTTSLAIGNNETKVLASGSVTVAHANDGTGSFSYSFSQEFWIHFDGESIRIVSGSGSAVLDTIARASTPTVSAAAVDMGSPLTIYTNRAAAFTHTLEYRFEGASEVIAQDVGDSAQWTPPPDLARQVPNAASGTAVITCTTYSGATPIGSKQVTVTLTVPESVVPTAEGSWEDISGAYGKLDTLVQNVSRLAVTVSGTGAYGSRITGAAVTLKGKAYGGGTITDAGALSLVVSVTDSRDRVGTKSLPITVAPYSAPSLTLSASRCTEDGTADEAGDHARITVTGHVTQVNGRNTGDLVLNYGGSEVKASLGTGNVSYQTDPVYADPNSAMAISAVLSDRLVSAERAMTLSTGYATLDLLAGGKGIAFGKAATREGFECAMPAYFTGQLYADSGGNSVPMFPAMGTGTEYQTPEWFRGYPVFRKIVNFGELASNTYKSVQVSSEDITVIEANVVIRGQSSATTIMLPYESGSKKYWHYATNKSLVIYTNSDAAGYMAFAEVRYIKGYKG